MKTTSTLSLLLPALASAATVTLKETACIQNNTELQEFTIDTDKLVVKELKSVCGLKIVSATTDVNAIVCQAFIDAAGTQRGSAEFTFAKPALISTNPVQEGSLFCKSSGGAASSVTTGGVTASQIQTQSQSVIVTLSTSVAPSSGPVPTGRNSTVPTMSRGPTAASSTTTGLAVPTGAAGRVGVSVGALAGALAMFFL